MKKIIPISLLLFLVGCDSRGTATSERVVQNIAPNIINCGGNNSLNDCYGYIVDKNTGVVYLYYSGYYKYGLTVMLNTDGTPITAEQLGIEY